MIINCIDNNISGVGSNYDLCYVLTTPMIPKSSTKSEKNINKVLKNTKDQIYLDTAANPAHPSDWKPSFLLAKKDPKPISAVPDKVFAS